MTRLLRVSAALLATAATIAACSGLQEESEDAGVVQKAPSATETITEAIINSQRESALVDDFDASKGAPATSSRTNRVLSPEMIDENAVPVGSEIRYKRSGSGDLLTTSRGEGVALLCRGASNEAVVEVFVDGTWYGESGCSGKFVATFSGNSLKRGSEIRLKADPSIQWALAFFDASE